MPRPRYSAGFALTEHTERFRWRLADIKWRWKNSIFSSKVIFTQLSRGNIVTKCLLLSFLKLECQTNLFLGNYLYSGGAQVHGQRVMERVADHEVLYCSSAAHKIVIGTEIFFGRQWESRRSDRFSYKPSIHKSANLQVIWKPLSCSKTSFFEILSRTRPDHETIISRPVSYL